MKFRVYDTEGKKWIKDNVYMSPDGNLFKIKQSLFGMVKIPMALDSYRYICHRNIWLTDKDGNEVFEGDYIRAVVEQTNENEENGYEKIVIGFVIYAQELSSYIILCKDDNSFYTLGSEICEFIQVIGNVFDGYEEESNQQTL